MMTKLDDERKEVINWTLKIAGFIMSIAIMISSWFLNQAWDRINQIENSVRDLEIHSASVSSSRFNSNDWLIAKARLDAESSLIDRRIVRLEEALPVIKDTLLDIKHTIKENKINE